MSQTRRAASCLSCVIHQHYIMCESPIMDCAALCNHLTICMPMCFTLRCCITHYCRLEEIRSPTPDGTYVGRAVVKAIFSIGKIGNIAGCAVMDGEVRKGASVRIMRLGRVVYEGKLKVLKNLKADAEVRKKPHSHAIYTCTCTHPWYMHASCIYSLVCSASLPNFECP